MKENYFTSLVSEGGKLSHKRWIAVSIAAVLAWAIVYAIMKANDASSRYSVIVATMVFILIMSGVATVAQIISAWKGTPTPKEDTKTENNEQK